MTRDEQNEYVITRLLMLRELSVELVGIFVELREQGETEDAEQAQPGAGGAVN